jgi:hypothetical protein
MLLSRLIASSALAASIATTACTGPNVPDLPSDQLLTSSHFRYHARADAVLDPTIVDRLEVHRSEFAQQLGAVSDVVDYYLFRDDLDLAEHSICPETRDCSSGHAVYTTDPFQEHELVHAFLGDLGDPPLAPREGVAQWSACLQPHTAQPVSSADWRSSFASDLTVYDFGERLVGWMMAHGGAPPFIDYYSKTATTTDADLFAQQIQTQWGQPIDAVVTEMGGPEFSRSVCPCAAPMLRIDAADDFVASEEYRVLELTAESRVEFGSATGVVVVPGDCTGTDELGLRVVPPHGRPMVTVARVAAGRYAVRTLPHSTGRAVVSTRQEPFGMSTCEATTPSAITPSPHDLTLWSDHRFANGLTWFSVTLDGPQLVSVSAAGTASVCDSCAAFCTTFIPGTIDEPFVPSSSGQALVAIAGNTTTDVAVMFRAPN